MSQSELLQQAIQKAGTGRALAQAIDHPEQHISMWKHGKQAMPDRVLAQLAVYIGRDPIETLGEVRGGTWQQVANSLKEKISEGFNWLLSRAKPRRDLLPAG